MTANNHDENGWYPGQIWVKEKNIELFKEKNIIKLAVANTGDRPIQVGSHFHFFEANKSLSFDRVASYGRRLAIPSGTAVRFEPGMTQEVMLVELAGERTCYGLNDLVSGKIDDESIKKSALKKAAEKGFKGL